MACEHGRKQAARQATLLHKMTEGNDKRMNNLPANVEDAKKARTRAVARTTSCDGESWHAYDVSFVRPCDDPYLFSWFPRTNSNPLVMRTNDAVEKLLNKGQAILATQAAEGNPIEYQNLGHGHK